MPSSATRQSVSTVLKGKAMTRVGLNRRLCVSVGTDSVKDTLILTLTLTLTLTQRLPRRGA